MDIQQVGTRGALLTFDDGISLYVIHGNRFHLLCDTHLGPESMIKVHEYLADKPRNNGVLVFNSHSDWDHIWGNGAFPDSIIIGHESCRRRMIERGQFDLTQNKSQQKGKVVLTFPNLTFSDKIRFDDENIEISYAPGHTIDSAICYDMSDKVLYVGDLVEDPIPYLDAKDLDMYLKTLALLLTHPSQVLVTAHSGIVTRDVVSQNIEYITRMKDGLPFDEQGLGLYLPVHQWNSNMRKIWEYDRIARKQVGDFSLIHLLQNLPDLHDIGLSDLKIALDEYFSLH
jgi:glyoxylase-like metal-dependent hydrolase (beta-lactamase superfamily II)